MIDFDDNPTVERIRWERTKRTLRRHEYETRTGREWGMRTRLVPYFSIDEQQNKIRLFRLYWGRGKRITDPGACRCRVSVSLKPRLFYLHGWRGPDTPPEKGAWRWCLLGLEVTFLRSYAYEG